MSTIGRIGPVCTYYQNPPADSQMVKKTETKVAKEKPKPDVTIQTIPQNNPKPTLTRNANGDLIQETILRKKTVKLDIGGAIEITYYQEYNFRTGEFNMRSRIFYQMSPNSDLLENLKK